ncbi:hypothetical protein IHE44_0015205 [Lamprotornis superbus]|uniref:Peptidase A2 domain-containing protein n=1 Tax=Lamprotornis superbus TaxID=245042 RepID=A0A835NCQ4_9PASS|nr:hypothetical protein IHE44_0015205 [Lamprotornis superbus]
MEKVSRSIPEELTTALGGQVYPRYQMQITGIRMQSDRATLKKKSTSTGGRRKRRTEGYKLKLLRKRRWQLPLNHWSNREKHLNGGTLMAKAALLDTGLDVTIVPSFAWPASWPLNTGRPVMGVGGVKMTQDLRNRPRWERVGGKAAGIANQPESFWPLSMATPPPCWAKPAPWKGGPSPAPSQAHRPAEGPGGPCYLHCLRKEKETQFQITSFKINQ